MTKASDGKIDALLAELWQRHLPTLRERLDVLDRAAAEASTGALAETLRIEALSVAHKLAGNLGMFGYQEGTETASKMEQILKTPSAAKLRSLAKLAKELRASVAAGL
jgi:HPt (histidine-containing phosphotransfer) domain-containing protein